MPLDIFIFLPSPGASSDLREAHPYGPPLEGSSDPGSDQSSFHFDLAVEMSPQASNDNRVIAVVSGLVRLIPDPATSGICSLVLLPSHEHARDLRRVLAGPEIAGAWDGANAAFVYRNIHMPSLTEIDTFANPWPKTPLDGYAQQIKILNMPPPELAEQMKKFLAGELSIEAQAGQRLLLPSLLGGHNGWSRVGFEIAFVPNGVGEQMNWSRLNELIEPSNKRTRRLDPLSFYSMVNSAGPEVRLAPEHANHPLLTICSRRVLLEVRDEYDDPIANTIVNITRADGSTTNRLVGNDAFGTMVLDAQGGDYSVSLEHHVVTNLPSGGSANAFQRRVLTPPSHWAIQSLFMADLDWPNSWFVTNTAPLRRYWPGNSVIPIRDGAEVFQRYAEAMQSLTGPGHFMYLAGWILMDGFPLGVGGLSAFELMEQAAVMGATVRVLLWEQKRGPKEIAADPLGYPANELEADRLNSLGDLYDVEAILDDHTHDCDALLETGTHHQKFLLIYGEKGPEIAFCGGVDLNQNRRDSPHHGAAAGYHDVHAQLDGPAVADVHRVFVDRWTSKPGRRAVSASAHNDLGSAGSVYVQVACTFPRMNFTDLRYPFAPDGSFTPLEALLRAIGKAKKFIYIEDQYLTPYAGGDAANTKDPLDDDLLGVLNALRVALDRIDYLIMVIPNHVAMGWLMKLIDHPGQARYRRRQFIRGLKAIAPEKVHVYYLARRSRRRSFDSGEDATSVGDGPGTSGSPDFPNEIYCHSKVWMVDDICMKIGSANCNARSYTHDSEMDLVMVDGAVSNGARALVRKFRRELWGEHLGLPSPDNNVLDDHLIALKYWQPEGRPAEARIQEYSYENLEKENDSEVYGWASLIDPNARDTWQ